MNYLLGIELNGSQLKISVLKKSGQHFDLVKLDNIFFANDEVEAVAQLNDWKAKNLNQAHSIKAVLTISESLLYTKEIEMPRMSNRQLSEAIYWEIPSISPITQAEAVYDWETISESEGSQKVLVIVGKSLYIENVISIFKKCQIDILAIEPSSYAISRISNANYDSNTLLCITREDGTDFMVLRKGLPLFTTSAANNLQTGKASKIKTEKDLTAELANGAKKIIDYWENKEGTKIEQIILCGDLVYKYFKMDSSVDLSASVPVRLGKIKKSDLLNTKNYKDLDLVSYIISLGAAVRHLQKDLYDGINLFPVSEKLKSEKLRQLESATKKLFGLFSINLFLLILIIASIFILNIWWYSLEKKLDKAQRLSTSHPANNFIKEIESTNKTIQNSILLTKRQEDIGERLRLISALAPQTVTLKSVSMSRVKTEDWTIHGVGDREGVLAFYENISANLRSSVLNMPYSNFNKEKENEFDINITW